MNSTRFASLASGSSTTCAPIARRVRCVRLRMATNRHQRLLRVDPQHLERIGRRHGHRLCCQYQVFRRHGRVVCVDYSDDTSFTPGHPRLALRNPFCCMPIRPRPTRSSAMRRIGSSRTRSAQLVQATLAGAKVESFEDDSFDDQGRWDDGETVRICEYWYKPVTKRLLLLEDGRTVGMTAAAGFACQADARCQHQDVYMCIASGSAILEGPTKWSPDGSSRS